jgi:hypothetical protein
LLDLYPADSLNDMGMLFWSGANRCPTELQFDFNDSTHLMYLMACSNLLACVLGIPQVRDLKTF